MNKIAFVTDSVASIPAEYVQRYKFHVVPNIVIWSGKEYRDGVDITPSELFARLKTEKELPTTAPVEPNIYKKVFASLLGDGFDILGIFQSSTMTRTFSSAQKAKELLGVDNIIVLDSRTTLMAVGWPLILAARAAEKGASLEECATLAREGLAHTGMIGTLDSLDHLQRSGRIGLVQSYLGSLLNTKPMIEVIDGEPVPAGRVRTRHKAMVELVKMTVARVNDRLPLHLFIGHNDALDDARTLMVMLQEHLEIDESVIGEMSPIGAVILGPGALGISFMAGIPEP